MAYDPSDRARLMELLRKAHTAGDTETARRAAQAVQRFDQLSSPAVEDQVAVPEGGTSEPEMGNFGSDSDVSDPTPEIQLTPEQDQLRREGAVGAAQANVRVSPATAGRRGGQFTGWDIATPDQVKAAAPPPLVPAKVVKGLEEQAPEKPAPALTQAQVDAIKAASTLEEKVNLALAAGIPEDMISQATRRASEKMTARGTRAPNEAAHEAEVQKILATHKGQGRPGFDVPKGSVEKEEDEGSWGEVIWDSVTNAPALFGRQIAGMQRKYHADSGAELDDFWGQVGAVSEMEGVDSPANSKVLEAMALTEGKSPVGYIQDLRDRRVAAAQSEEEAAAEFQKYTSYLEAYRPRVREESMKFYAGAILEAGINMMPSIGAGIVTGSPSVGLALMGTQVFGDSYSQARESGRTHGEATQDAMFSAAAEVVAERLPLEVLMKKGGGLLKKTLKAAGMEGAEEMFTEALNMGYELGVLNGDVTFGEAMTRLKQAGIIGAGMGGTLAVAFHPLSRNEAAKQKKLDPETQEAVEAHQGFLAVMARASDPAQKISRKEVDAARERWMNARAALQSKDRDAAAGKQFKAGARATVEGRDGELEVVEYDKETKRVILTDGKTRIASKPETVKVIEEEKGEKAPAKEPAKEPAKPTEKPAAPAPAAEKAPAKESAAKRSTPEKLKSWVAGLEDKELVLAMNTAGTAASDTDVAEEKAEFKARYAALQAESKRRRAEKRKAAKVPGVPEVPKSPILEPENVTELAERAAPTPADIDALRADYTGDTEAFELETSRLEAKIGTDVSDPAQDAAITSAVEARRRVAVAIATETKADQENAAWAKREAEQAAKRSREIDRNARQLVEAAADMAVEEATVLAEVLEKQDLDEAKASPAGIRAAFAAARASLEAREAKAKERWDSYWEKPVRGALFDVTEVLVRGTQQYGTAVEIGAIEMSKGVIRFADWSAKVMIAMGEHAAKAKPVLRDIYEDAKKHIAEGFKRKHRKFQTGTRKGQLVSAPPGKNTPQAVAALRRQIEQLAKEGEPGKNWYEDSGREVLRIAGGDVEDARRIAGLLSIFSSGTGLAPNTTNALKAWYQWKSGRPIQAGMYSRQDDAATQWLESGEEPTGMKRSNFYTNLMREIMPEKYGIAQGATVDLWMMRAFGYEGLKEAPGEAQYAFVQTEIKQLAEKLGWEVQQVQAAVWVAMKGRWETTFKDTKLRAIRAGKAHYVTEKVDGKMRKVFKPTGIEPPVGKKTADYTTAEKQFDENRRWIMRTARAAALKLSMDEANKAIEKSKLSYLDMLNSHYGMITWEAQQSRSLSTEEAGLPLEWKVVLQQRMAEALTDPETGREYLAEWLGLLGSDGYFGPGAWQMDIGAMKGNQVVLPPRHKAGEEKKAAPEERDFLEPGARELMDAYAMIYGFILKQDGVAWHRPFYALTKAESNGVEVDIDRPLTPEEALRVYEAMTDLAVKHIGMSREDATQFAPIATPSGFRVLNLKGSVPNFKVGNKNYDFHTMVRDAARVALPEEKHTLDVFRTEGNMPENDWAKNPKGETYVEGISALENPAVQKAFERAKRELTPRIAEVRRSVLAEYRGGKAAAQEAEPAAPVSLARPVKKVTAALNMGAVKEGGEAASMELLTRFGTVTPGQDTAAELRIYNLTRLIKNPRLLDKIAKKYGFEIEYFSFQENEEMGVEFKIPELKKRGYDKGVAWIYDPRNSDGSFKGAVEYTRAWRISHEIGHGISEHFMQEKYGDSKRYGRLGRTHEVERGKPPKQKMITERALTLMEAQRAVEWEDVAFRTQRMILAEMGIEITDADFAREYNVNISDAAYRVLTGGFNDPGDRGFRPSTEVPKLKDVLALLERAEAALAKEQGREPTAGIDLKTWKSVSDEALRAALAGKASTVSFSIADPMHGPAMRAERVLNTARMALGNLGGWAEAPFDVHVVDTVADLPGDVRRAIGSVAALRPADVEGIFFDSRFDDRPTIYLVASSFGSSQRVIETVMHEAVGHFGIRGLLGKSYGNIMREVYRSFPAEVREAGRRNNIDMSDGQGIAHAAEEFIAYAAGRSLTNGTKLPDFFEKMVRRIKLFLVQRGWSRAKLNDRDVLTLIARASGFVRKGGRWFGGPARMYAARRPLFFSQMHKALAEKLPERGPVQEMIKQIEAHARKGAFRLDEMKYTNIIEWMKDLTPQILKDLGKRGYDTASVASLFDDQGALTKPPKFITKDIILQYIENEGLSVSYENPSHAKGLMRESAGGTIAARWANHVNASNESLHDQMSVIRELPEEQRDEAMWLFHAMSSTAMGSPNAPIIDDETDARMAEKHTRGTLPELVADARATEQDMNFLLSYNLGPDMSIGVRAVHAVRKMMDANGDQQNPTPWFFYGGGRTPFSASYGVNVYVRILKNGRAEVRLDFVRAESEHLSASGFKSGDVVHSGAVLIAANENTASVDAAAEIALEFIEKADEQYKDIQYPLKYSQYLLDNNKGFERAILIDYGRPQHSYLNGHMQSHWGVSGLISHVRGFVGDVTIGGQTESVNVIDELQSDMHQYDEGGRETDLAEAVENAIRMSANILAHLRDLSPDTGKPMDLWVLGEPAEGMLLKLAAELGSDTGTRAAVSMLKERVESYSRATAAWNLPYHGEVGPEFSVSEIEKYFLGQGNKSAGTAGDAFQKLADSLGERVWKAVVGAAKLPGNVKRVAFDLEFVPGTSVGGLSEFAYLTANSLSDGLISAERASLLSRIAVRMLSEHIYAESMLRLFDDYFRWVGVNPTHHEDDHARMVAAFTSFVDGDATDVAKAFDLDALDAELPVMMSGAGPESPDHGYAGARRLDLLSMVSDVLQPQKEITDRAREVNHSLPIAGTLARAFGNRTDPRAANVVQIIDTVVGGNKAGSLLLRTNEYASSAVSAAKPADKKVLPMSKSWVRNALHAELAEAVRQGQPYIAIVPGTLHALRWSAKEAHRRLSVETHYEADEPLSEEDFSDAIDRMASDGEAGINRSLSLLEKVIRTLSYAYNENFHGAEHRAGISWIKAARAASLAGSPERAKEILDGMRTEGKAAIIAMAKKHGIIGSRKVIGIEQAGNALFGIDTKEGRTLLERFTDRQIAQYITSAVEEAADFNIDAGTTPGFEDRDLLPTSEMDGEQEDDSLTMGLGLKRFYDEDLVRVINRDFKRFGMRSEDGTLRVETTGVNHSGDAIGTRSTDRDAVDAGVQVIRITDEYRDFVANEGMPMFSISGRNTGNTELDAFLNKIGTRSKYQGVREMLKAWFHRFGERLRVELLDQYYGVLALEKKLGISTRDSGYVSMRLASSTEALVRALLEFGFPVWNDGAADVDTSMGGFLDILEGLKDPDKLMAWEAWMVARRSNRLKKENRENLFTQAEIDAALHLPVQRGWLVEFEEIAEKYAKFKNKVLDFASEAGLVNEETRPLWEHADHIPFYRVLQNEGLSGPFSAGAIGNVKKQIHRLRGGTENLRDPLENMITNFAVLMDAALKNHASRLVIKNFEGQDEILQKAPQLVAAKALVPLEQVRDMLFEAGVSIDAMGAQMLEGMRSLLSFEAPAGDNVIHYQEQGKKVYYYVHDPLILRGLTGLNPNPWSALMWLLRAPKRFVSTAITLAPDFILRNWFRDMWHAFVLGRDGKVPVKPGWDSVIGAVSALRKDQRFISMMAGGATFESGYVNAHDPASTSKIIRGRIASRGLGSHLLNTPRKVFEFYRDISSSAENSHRVIVYQRALDAGKSRKEALYEGRDLMDFSMRGRNAVIRFLAETVPFWNARMQGLYRTGKGFKREHVLGTLARGMPIMMASIALLLMNRDDERYKGLEDWEKQAYYHFFDVFEEGDWYRLPKPFEIGSLFSSLPEIMVEHMLSQEPDQGKYTGKAIAHVFLETLNFSPQIQTVTPIYELAINKSLFTKRPILSDYEKGLVPELQVGAGTSPVIEAISKGMPDAAPEVVRSPKMLEHLVLGYTGTLGSYGVAVADYIWHRAHSDTQGLPPDMRTDQMPVVKAFVRDKDPRYTKWLTNLYDVLDEADRIHLSILKMEKTQDPESITEALELRQKHQALLISRDAYRNVADHLSRINKQIRVIEKAPAIDPAEKRKQIDNLVKMKNELARSVFDLRPSKIGKQIDEQDLRGMTLKQKADTLRNAGFPRTGDLLASVNLSPRELRDMLNDKHG